MLHALVREQLGPFVGNVRLRAMPERDLPRERRAMLAFNVVVEIRRREQKVSVAALHIEVYTAESASLRGDKRFASVASDAHIGWPLCVALLVLRHTRAAMTSKRHLASGLVIVGSAILAAVGLALVWRYTPLADIVTPDSTIAFAESVSGYWWAPLALILSYTPATVVMFPRWLITLAAVAIFGPWPAFAYAEAGVLLAALCSYVAGTLVGIGTVRRMAGPRLNRVKRLLRRRGVVAVTVVRLVPVAPFIVVNVVMGALRIPLHHFLIGTVLGMLPGTLATTVLGDQLTDALAAPARANLWIAGAAVFAIAMIAFAGQRWLRHADADDRSKRA